MKIAEVVATFPPHHGGMGYICFRNACALAERGHDVTVFTLDNDRVSSGSDSDLFRVTRLRAPLSHGDGGTVPHLYSRLRGFDVIHLHYPFFGGAEFVYLASLFRRQKYFLTYHMDVYGNTLLKKLVVAAYESLLLKRIVRRASLIGCPSIAHLESSKIARIVSRDRLADVQYGGVDTETFRPRPKDKNLLKQYALENKTVVLFVGNLQPFKGLRLLIDAVAGTKDDSLALLIVGGGYAEDEYKSQVKRKGMESRIVFAGPKLHDKELPAYYNSADFLVLPSTHSESLGLVVLEAMASGIPSIVSSLPGPTQLIKHGEDGLIAEVGDLGDLTAQIQRLSGDHDLCARLGAAARTKASGKYTWERIGQELEGAFDRIVRTV